MFDKDFGSLYLTKIFFQEDEWDQEIPELKGTLNKWTNYIHGWQKRFMVIKVIFKSKYIYPFNIVLLLNLRTA